MTRWALSLCRSLVCITALAIGGFAIADPETAPGYAFGQGLSIPDLGLEIGGYASLLYASADAQSPAFSVQDLSLILTKELGGRWVFFTEMEVGNALYVGDDHDSKHSPEFDLERLYADYRMSSAMTLRIGKFLTPVGSWNLIHAAPLVWTVSRPLTSTAAFGRHASGLMLHGTLSAAGQGLDYWLFAEDSADLDPLQRHERAFDVPGSTLNDTNNFDHAFGGRLLYQVSDTGLALGLSYLNAEIQDAVGNRNLVGVDINWTGQGVEVTGEAISRTASGLTAPDERGAFLQAVLPLPQRLYLIGRYERYKADVLTATIETLGLTYRPSPPLSIKVERRMGEHNDEVAPDAWLASVAILF